MECGELFMTTVDGTSMMRKSCADNWDTLLSVSYPACAFTVDTY